MIFILLTLINLIWIGYSMTEGAIEGFLDYYRSKNRRNPRFNINMIFNIQRLIILILSVLILSNKFGCCGVIFTIGQILMFFYFHKLAYEISANKLYGECSRENKYLYIKNNLKLPLLIIGVISQIFIYTFLLT